MVMKTGDMVTGFVVIGIKMIGVGSALAGLAAIPADRLEAF
jgi:hypothetical protein